MDTALVSHRNKSLRKTSRIPTRTVRKYSPNDLTLTQKEMVMFILQTRKASQIISILKDKSSAYLNELQKKVGGSKTNTMVILDKLEDLHVVRSKWDIETFGGSDRHKVRRAIKVFELEESVIDLIKHYYPLLRFEDSVYTSLPSPYRE